MKKHVTIAMLAAILVTAPLVPGAANPKGIIDCYRLLVRDKLITDVLTSVQGLWLYKETLDGETVVSRGKPVVDVKNGYIHMAFELRGSRSTVELAYFISADKRNFIAISDDYAFLEGSGYLFKFYNCDNDKLTEVSPFPVRITYRDFLNEAGRRNVEELTGNNESLCVVTYQLPASARRSWPSSGERQRT